MHKKYSSFSFKLSWKTYYGGVEGADQKHDSDGYVDINSCNYILILKNNLLHWKIVK